MSVAVVAVREVSTLLIPIVLRWERNGRGRTGRPDVLSANIPILVAKAESEEVEVCVEREAGRGEGVRLEESEEEKRDEGREPEHC